VVALSGEKQSGTMPWELLHQLSERTVWSELSAASAVLTQKKYTGAEIEDIVEKPADNNK